MGIRSRRSGRYKLWGEIRSYTATPPANMEDPDYYQMTRYTFTGQYSDSTINLLWYNSWYYDPYHEGRWRRFKRRGGDSQNCRDVE
jgi:hypothetical protein